MAPPEYMGAKYNIITLQIEQLRTRAQKERARSQGWTMVRQKKRRKKEALLKKRERTGQIISQQELKEKTRQNGQNLIASIFFFLVSMSTGRFSFHAFLKRIRFRTLALLQTQEKSVSLQYPS